THITFTDKEDQGFFMKKAYRMPDGHTPQNLLVQSLIVTPRPDQTVGVGKISITGKTFSGSGAITKIDYSTDNGKRWHSMLLQAPHQDGGWQEFKAEIEAKKPGTLTIMARATDAAGNVQPL